MSEVAMVRLHHPDGSLSYVRADRVLSITEADTGSRVRADGIIFNVAEDPTEVLGLVSRALSLMHDD